MRKIRLAAVSAAVLGVMLVPVQAQAASGGMPEGLSCTGYAQLGPKTYAQLCIEVSGSWYRAVSHMQNRGDVQETMSTGLFSIRAGDKFVTNGCVTNAGWVKIAPYSMKTCASPWLNEPDSWPDATVTVFDQRYNVERALHSPIEGG
ncbi:hypothetical protein ACF064_32365 [Streptomyces sp. NPDC015492]|uniref:hypothetical protein n=1 Tax=Streptomyces sp. NPDC015492 TaxID=3364958 RepID=UPI0036FE8ECC